MQNRVGYFISLWRQYDKNHSSEIIFFLAGNNSSEKKAPSDSFSQIVSVKVYFGQETSSRIRAQAFINHSPLVIEKRQSDAAVFRSRNKK